MLRFVFSLLLVISSLLSNSLDNSFITQFEYGEMLYNNPRGVACVSCHKKGDTAVIIAQYREINKKTKVLEEKTIIAPAINKVSFEVFVDKMKSDKSESKVMPTYFLTDEELKSLYYYIKNIK